MDDLYARISSAAHDGALGLNNLKAPTLAQQKAGNYRVGRLMLHGLPISIEQPRNSYREGTDPNGVQWRCRMAADYGYIRGYRGADGDNLDVFIGLVPESDKVFVINQVSPDTGAFDEHKVMLGYMSEAGASRAYLESYSRDWKGLGSIVPCTLTQFKWWLKNGDLTRPITAKSLPYDGHAEMNQWDSNANPVGTDMTGLMYKLRQEDKDNLLLDAVTVEDVLEAADEVLEMDALVTPYSQIERKMGVLQTVMNAAGDAVKPVAMQITDPFKQAGTTNVAAVFELSDGQTVGIFFHNPDTTPAKIKPQDDLISWKWMLNKRDITLLVAPENGADLNVREVARRIMKVAEKNSASFARVNKNRAERLAAIAGLKTDVESKEAELASLTAREAELQAQLEAKQAEPAAPTAGEYQYSIDDTDGFMVTFTAPETIKGLKVWAREKADAMDKVQRAIDIHKASPYLDRRWNSPWGEVVSVSLASMPTLGPDSEMYTVAYSDGSMRNIRASDFNETAAKQAHDATPEGQAEKAAREAKYAADIEAAKKRDAEKQAADDAANAKIKKFTDAYGYTSMAAGKAREYLKTQVNYAGFGAMARMDFIENRIEAGARVTSSEENRIKDLSRTRFNRMDQREQDAHAKRQKEAGKKTVYYLSDFEITKVEADYAEYLASKRGDSQEAGSNDDQVNAPVDLDQIKAIFTDTQPMDGVPADWIIMNAPRPLVGDKLMENGDFLDGRFYAAIDPKASTFALYVNQNVKDAAAIVMVIPKDKQAAMAISGTKYEAMYKGLPVDQRARAVQPMINKLQGKTYGELKALMASVKDIQFSAVAEADSQFVAEAADGKVDFMDAANIDRLEAIEQKYPGGELGDQLGYAKTAAMDAIVDAFEKAAA